MYIQTVGVKMVVIFSGVS